MSPRCKSCDTYIHLLREVFISFFETPGPRETVREGIEAMSEAEFLRFLDKWLWATREIKEEEEWKH